MSDNDCFICCVDDVDTMDLPCLCRGMKIHRSCFAQMITTNRDTQCRTCKSQYQIDDWSGINLDQNQPDQLDSPAPASNSSIGNINRDWNISSNLNQFYITSDGSIIPNRQSTAWDWSLTRDNRQSTAWYSFRDNRWIPLSNY
jgi:hypothetical protein